MIETTRPVPDRSETQKKIYDTLDILKIPFERLEHEAAATIEQCKKIDEELEIKICKNLFLCNRQKTEFVLLVMDGDKRFVTKDFSKKINSSRLSFASEDDLMKYLNVKPGSASILCLIFDKENKVRVYIDKSVAEQEYMGCHPCDNTASLKLRTEDIMNKFITYTGHKAGIVEI